jgi:hypothetical protein
VAAGTDAVAGAADRRDAGAPSTYYAHKARSVSDAALTEAYLVNALVSLHRTTTWRWCRMPVTTRRQDDEGSWAPTATLTLARREQSLDKLVESARFFTST